MSLTLDKSTWKRVAFGDVVRNVNDYYIPDVDGVLPYVAGPHISAGQPTVSDYGLTNDDQFPPTFKRKFAAGDVLLHSRGIEKLAVADRAGVTGEKLFVLRTTDECTLSQRLLVWLLQGTQSQRHMRDNFTGSVNKFLNWKPLAELQFDLPPPDQQKRIAALLWAAENERHATVAVLAAADSVRAMARNQLVGDLLDKEVPFASVCIIPSQNGVSLKKSERAGVTPMVNMGEMFRGEVISTSSNYERVTNPGENFALVGGDLLFARRSIVFEGAGACCLVPQLPEPFTFESSVIRARVDPQAVDPRYILHFFRSARGREVMAQIVRRGPVSGIAGSDLRTLSIPLPALESQRRLVRLVESAGTPRPALEQRAATALALRHAVMDDVFGGN